MECALMPYRMANLKCSGRHEGRRSYLAPQGVYESALRGVRRLRSREDSEPVILLGSQNANPRSDQRLQLCTHFMGQDYDCRPNACQYVAVCFPDIVKIANGLFIESKTINFGVYQDPLPHWQSMSLLKCRLASRSNAASIGLKHSEQRL